ncbi:unnamed protein product [Tetraodon nigroviridis]|uniref:(spotted green pufferfish) hypothetical protein n=1 Tax=Tetraodon nigroviridis TaxID=99883 RepID=Q4RPW6_TETNG|nr:unnamed protein product [Tetraodon nigroviridis]
MKALGTGCMKSTLHKPAERREPLRSPGRFTPRQGRHRSSRTAYVEWTEHRTMAAFEPHH